MKLLRYCKHIVEDIFGIVILKESQHPTKNMLGLKKIYFSHVFDVGANIGQFAKQTRKTHPNSQIHSFEPIPEAYQKLSEWATSQNDMVIANNFGLSSECQEMSMYKHDSHLPSSSVLKNTKIGEKIYPQTKSTQIIEAKFITLDSYAAENNLLSKADCLLKIDVQGFELQVLKGAEETLNNCKIIIVEYMIESLYENQASFMSICEFLISRGFVYKGNLDQSYNENGEVVFVDLLFAKIL